MKVSMYAVFDRASAIYDGPFPGQTDGVMVRNFTHTVMNADSAIAKSPEDFTLFKVGTWDDAKGELTACVPVKLINGAEALASTKRVMKDNEEILNA